MKEIDTSEVNVVEAIDIFCGVGGLSYGLKQAGINVVAGVDIDEHCKFGFETNIGGKFIKSDISLVDPEELKGFFSEGSVKVVAGCPPCQPFSKYRNGKVNYSDEKWSMINKFLDVVRNIKPDYITMENVPELASKLIFLRFIDDLVDMGYYVEYRIVNAVDFGSAQKRRRLVVVGSLYNSVFPLGGADTKTVRDVIGHLPPIGAGEQHKTLRYHKSARLSKKNLERIRVSIPGGTWKDWPKHLVADCHTRESGKNYFNVYGRMEWDKQAPTMTTMCFGFGNGRFGHPEQDRGISMLEAALLQGFPSDFEFFPNEMDVSIKHLSRMIGNAIPIQIAHAIGVSIMRDISKS